jgi:uncharacterized membrane protein (DUF4010 family)
VDEYNLYLRFGVSLAIGVLMGLQREYAFEGSDRELFAGVRTFALLGLLGSAAAFISDYMNSPWPFFGALLVLGVFLNVTYYVDATRGKMGLTSEISALLTMLIGGMAYQGNITLAVALGVSMAFLLSIKLEAQRFVRRINRADIFAILKFAAVAAVVLPILPNEVYGPPPFDVFNPYSIWLLVVLISGISFVGYILNKILGAEKGIGLTGLLGGLASSTAVTWNFSRRSKEAPDLAQPFALGIIVSWTIMFLRVLAQVAAVNPSLVRYLWLPMVAAAAAGLAYIVFLFIKDRSNGDNEKMEFTNPFELGPAITFGILFAVILFVSRAAQIYLSELGLYMSSLAAGIADVNAITLSMATLSRGQGGIDPQVATRAIVLATVSNTFFKGLIVMGWSTKMLRLAILPGFVLILTAGVLVAFLF